MNFRFFFAAFKKSWHIIAPPKAVHVGIASESFRCFFTGFLLLFFAGIAFAGPAVSSPTHPDQESWYKASTVEFVIETPGNGYSFVFDTKPDTVPDEKIVSSDSEVSFPNRTTGLQYFHVRVKNGSTWSDTTHFKVQIDRTAPSPPQSPSAGVLPDGKIELKWAEASDADSGPGGYKIYRAFLRDFDIRESYVKVVEENIAATTFVDSEVEEGKVYHYRVQAIDAAGNLGGVTRSFFAKVPTNCDFEPQLQTTLVDGNLTIRIDSSPYLMRFATLVLKPAQGEEIVVFSSRSNQDLLISSVDVSHLADQQIVLDFNVKDESDDVCDVEQVFFLDRILPDGRWVFPAPNAVLKENISLKVNANDSGTNASGVSRVELYYAGESLQKIGDAVEGEGGEFSFDWNSLNVSNGRFEFVAKIFDRAENVVEKTVLASVQNTALISAQARSAIDFAGQKKLLALEKQAELDSLGIVSEEFFSLLQNADSNLLRAKDVFSRNVNFERAISDAETASDLFIDAANAVSIEKTQALQRVFSDEEKNNGFKKVGLAAHLVGPATANLGDFAPVRRLEIYKIVDGNSTVYRPVFVVTLTAAGDSNQLVQIVEVVPKDISQNASGLSSSGDFSVLNSDPVLKFNLDLNNSNRVTYFLVKNFSKAEIDAFVATEPLKKFQTLPIVLPKEVQVDSFTVVKPFDLFEEFSALTAGYDQFTLMLIGVGLIVGFFIVVGIIVFFILLLLYLKRKR